MAVTVKVIRHSNPVQDTAGTSDYAVAVDNAIGGTTPANTKVSSAWDEATGSLVTTICIFS
jgi:hypothetical protein